MSAKKETGPNMVHEVTACDVPKKNALAATIGAAVEARKTQGAADADLIYIGPTIAGAVKYGTVFKGGILPEKAMECIAELPQMRRLFVEPDRAALAMNELHMGQGATAAIYAQASARFGA